MIIDNGRIRPWNDPQMPHCLMCLGSDALVRRAWSPGAQLVVHHLLPASRPARAVAEGWGEVRRGVRGTLV